MSAKPAPARFTIVVLLIMCGVGFFWFLQEGGWHDKRNLPAEYGEIFATPFNRVEISEYWNASVGHGTKFAFLFDSTEPIQIKDEATYERTKDIPDKAKYPWAVISLYKESNSGDVSIVLDESRRRGHIFVHTPTKSAKTMPSPSSSDRRSRAGPRLTTVMQFKWPNEVTQMDAAANEAWFKEQEAKGFQFHDMGPNASLISVAHAIDPRTMSAEEFESKIRGYLTQLDCYNPQNLPQKVTEKVLELVCPDLSLSKDDVAVLTKITDELSANYDKPYDGKTWRMRSRNGQIPIRLKLMIPVADLD